MWVLNKPACLCVPVITFKGAAQDDVLPRRRDREHGLVQTLSHRVSVMKSGSFSPTPQGIGAQKTGLLHPHICFSNPILINVTAPYGSRSESGADSNSDRSDSEHQPNMCSSLTRRHRKRAGEAGAFVPRPPQLSPSA